MFALYSSYGYDEGDIAMLFIIGFLASLIVGTFVGALSDKYGRRFMCIGFAVLYFIAGQIIFSSSLMPSSATQLQYLRAQASQR